MMRQQDADEVRAAGWQSLHEAVHDSVSLSEWSRVVRCNGVLVAIFGVRASGTLLSPCGIPWMLGTPALMRHRLLLHRMARKYVSDMLHKYGHLFNVVDARNSVSISWLKRLGFQFHDPVEFRGHQFIPFEMRA